MKKNKLPSLISVLILTLLTSVMWVSFNVYRALTTETPAEVPKEIIEPLTPTLDRETINQIESRIFLDESQIPDVVSVPVTQVIGTPLPSPTPISTPIASPEAEPIP